MNRQKIFRFTISVVIGGLFLWLAFQNVDFEALLTYFQSINYGWIAPFTIVTLGAHYLRAERWRLLITERELKPSRLVLFSGVMVGYLMNYVFPRLGEVSRSAYVGKREDLRISTLVGTVILERAIDLITMFALVAVVFVYIIADLEVLSRILGEQTIAIFEWVTRVPNAILVVVLGAFLAAFSLYLTRILLLKAQKIDKIAPFAQKVYKLLKMFLDGLLAVREVKHWGRFLTYTILIWVGYVLMTYIPFGMFDLQETYDLGFLDAMAVAMLSAIGIALPSPGGVGTYHFFVKQSLLVLFMVPAVTGLAFALVLHAIMFLVVLVTTPILLLIERLWLKNSNSSEVVPETGNQ